jgi:tRNA/tmRNA/rRNA uracil-C5-methylase (TrmA/RlmC/RlmD family)
MQAPGLPSGGDGDAGDGLVELIAGEVAHGGWCVARDPGGRVVFVRHALPGERVRARITDATARFARAEAVEIVEPSPDRAEPPCQYARPGGCGGCDWQHASLPAQRRLKAEVVRQQLRRIAGLDREVTVEPVAGDNAGLGWRTRVRFTVRPDGRAGLLRHRSHDVVPVDDCLIAHPLARAADITGQRWPGARWVEAAASPGSGERAVIVSPGSSRSAPAAAQVAAQEADTVAAARGGRLATLRGRGYLRQTAAGRDWRAGAGVFWQGHPGAADVLTAAVLAALQPQPGDAALDLYCGAGLFAGVLATAVGPTGSVIGVEADPAAVRDARYNLRATPWARIHRGDAAAVLARGGWPGVRLAVLDPPRTGAGRPVIERLLNPPAGAGAPGTTAGGAGPAGAAALERIAYVSCDPATLARDIAVFAEAGWQLGALRAFDAFPMTHHIECVATLIRQP